jgi:hypothetical protein
MSERGAAGGTRFVRNAARAQVREHGPPGSYYTGAGDIVRSWCTKNKLATVALKPEGANYVRRAHAEPSIFVQRTIARCAILRRLPAASRFCAANTTVAPASMSSPRRSHASAPATAARTLTIISGW